MKCQEQTFSIHDTITKYDDANCTSGAGVATEAHDTLIPPVMSDSRNHDIVTLRSL